MKNIVSIHQPTFFPWYPFFQKIQQSNTFIFLTHCQFEKNGYQNRFDIDKTWYTMSTYKGLDPIVQKKYVNPSKDWNKIKNSLEPSYGRRLLEEFDDCIQESLCETNTRVIKKICSILDIDTRLTFDYKTNLSRTERLVDLCESHSATHYMSGIGGKNYLEEKLFESKSIQVFYQNTEEMIKKPVLDIIKEKY